jgi:hypothetical protein
MVLDKWPLAGAFGVCLLSTFLGAVVVAKPRDGGYRVESVHLEVEHQADGKKYPNYLKESYRLDGEGTLEYSAYFGGVPMEMNHMDSATWKSGRHGQKVFAAIAALLADPAGRAALRERPDGTPMPSAGEAVYLVSLAKDGHSSTRQLAPAQAKAYGVLDQAFQALIAQFERETGRPRTVGDLPQ